MSIVGLKIQQGGHTWEVVGARREGPRSRISFRSTTDSRCKAQGTVDRPRPPSATDVSACLAQAEFRWFPDREGRVWKAEIGPRYENGSLRGHWLIFSADRGPDRLKWPYEGSGSLGAFEDIKLLEYLLRAQRGH